MNKIYFVRHGDYNHSDDSLTERGIMQAKVIGRNLEERDRKYIVFTSPYRRAVATATILSTYISHVDRIEMHILREYESKEEYSEMVDRALLVNQIISGPIGYDVVVVSHRAVLRAMLQSLLNEDPKKIKIDKGMVYEFQNIDGKARYIDRWGG